jgi:DNA protecting protein DprA
MSEISNPARLLLALAQLPGVGPATLKKIVATSQFQQCSIDEVAAQVPAVAKALKVDCAWDRAQEGADAQVREAQRHNAKILCMLDPEYPALLAGTKDDPFILFVRGSLATKPENSVAIIGTREPTPHGMVIARRITQFFAESGWSIVSGLAIGCDTLAHETALEAGAHTVAVLAHGLQMIAPTRNRQLAERILSSGGALVSEYPFGREVQKQQYVKRDRTQAGMAQGVVMIQSDLVGGSLHASRAALDYNRWLAVPYPTENDRERNEAKIQANLLIAEGDNAKRGDLLRCQPSSLARVLILKSREDYLLMKQGVEGIVAHVADNRILAPRTDLFQNPVANQVVSEANIADLASGPLEDGIGSASTRDSAAAWVHVQLRAATLAELNLSTESASRVWNALGSSSPALMEAVRSRLMHLQTRHTKISMALGDLCSNGDVAHQQALSFAVDDFVDQMGHAAELLVALQSVLPSHGFNTQTAAAETAPLNGANDEDASALHAQLASRLHVLREASTERLISASSGHLHEELDTVTRQEEEPSDTMYRLRANPLLDQISELCILFNRLLSRSQ